MVYSRMAGKRHVCLTNTQPNSTWSKLIYSLLKHQRMAYTQACGIAIPLQSFTMKIKKSTLSYLQNIFSLTWKSHLVFPQTTHDFFLNRILVLLSNLLFVVRSAQDIWTFLYGVILSTNLSRIQNKMPNSKESLRWNFEV